MVRRAPAWVFKATPIPQTAANVAIRNLLIVPPIRMTCPRMDKDSPPNTHLLVSLMPERGPLLIALNFLRVRLDQCVSPALGSWVMTRDLHLFWSVAIQY
jgi:hypothetical protein